MRRKVGEAMLVVPVLGAFLGSVLVLLGTPASLTDLAARAMTDVALTGLTLAWVLVALTLMRGRA